MNYYVLCIIGRMWDLSVGWWDGDVGSDGVIITAACMAGRAAAACLQEAARQLRALSRSAAQPLSYCDAAALLHQPLLFTLLVAAPGRR